MDNEELKNQITDLKDEMRGKYSATPRDNKQKGILIIIIILLLCGAAYGWQQYQNLRVDLNIAEQNTAALSDSVRVSENKLGDVEFSKNILVAEKNELAVLSKDLAEELKKEKGKVHELTKYVVSIKNKPADTVKITNTLIQYTDGSKGLKWKHDTTFIVVKEDGSIDSTNSRHIAGTSKFSIDSLTGLITPLETFITRDEINFNIIQGMRENKDGNVEIFVRSDYPDFSVGDMQSAIIDPKSHPVLKKYTKQKRWGVGPMVAGGLGINMWPSPNIGFGLMFGVSVQYSLFRF